MSYEIKEVSFSAKKYLALKKEIAITEITNKTMYDEAYKKVFGYIRENKIKITGPGAVLYFKWDEPRGRASIAIAARVEYTENVKDPELSVVDVKESKAAFAELHGSYDRLKDVHESLLNYMNKQNLNSKLTVEEYAVDPSREPNPINWITNVYYLYN